MLANSNVELGIKLYLQTTLAADNIAALGHKDEFGPIVYELVSQAFVLYEEEIGDSKAQTKSIKVMIGTLLACQTLSNEEYESLIPKAAQYSAKLLKKPDQCQMVALCAHLFYTTRDRVRSGALNLGTEVATCVLHRVPSYNRMDLNTRTHNVHWSVCSVLSSSLMSAREHLPRMFTYLSICLTITCTSSRRETHQSRTSMCRDLPHLSRSTLGRLHHRGVAMLPRSMTQNLSSMKF